MVASFVLPVTYSGGAKLAGAVQREIVAVNVAQALELPSVVDKTARELRDEMMDRLHKGEGAGKSVKVGQMFFTYDPPQSMKAVCSKIGGIWPMECFSIGEYQMKVSFIQHYYPLIHEATITEEAAIALANDPVKARAFAEVCIVEVEGCVWKWSAALKDAEYFEVVIPIIRKLEQ